MVVLIDMDDVLEDLLTPWCRTLSERHGLNVTREDVVDWEMSKFFPSLSREELFAPLGEIDFWKNVEPTPGAQEALKELEADGHELYLVTSSHYGTIRTKMRHVVRRLFPQFTAENLIVTRRKQMIRGDVLVDDNPDNLIGGAYEKILMDVPHNRNFDERRHGIVRVADWNEAVATIRGLEFERIDSITSGTTLLPIPSLSWTDDVFG